jgi:hypothetical protein
MGGQSTKAFESPIPYPSPCLQLSTTVNDQHGVAFNTLPAGVTVTSVGPSPATASVDGASRVTGEKRGEAMIRATAGHVHGETRLTVATSPSLSRGSDPSQIRADAQAIVDACAAEAARTRSPFAEPPTVRIRSTPQLIFFSGNRMHVHTC